MEAWVSMRKFSGEVFEGAPTIVPAPYNTHAIFVYVKFARKYLCIYRVYMIVVRSR